MHVQRICFEAELSASAELQLCQSAALAAAAVSSSSSAPGPENGDVSSARPPTLTIQSTHRERQAAGKSKGRTIVPFTLQQTIAQTSLTLLTLWTAFMSACLL